MNIELRPDFFHGQYIGADDLDTLITYFRNQLARHAIGSHTWGIVVGLDVVEMSGPSGELDVFVLPGYAVDGYGRAIVVKEPCRLSLELFTGLSSQSAELWLAYDEGALSAVRPGFAACNATDRFTRIGEGFVLEAGPRKAINERQAGISISGEALDDARQALQVFDDSAPLICDGSIPFQELPRSPEADRWLIPLGLVGYQSGTPGHFVPLSDADRLLSRRRRRYVSVPAESILATDGVIRLRDRKTHGKSDADTECEKTAIHESDLRICAGRPELSELVWLEGRVRVTGDLRLFGAQLELRDAHGAGPTAESGGPSTPLLVRRLEMNERDGQELQLLVGQSEDDDGRNRVTIGNVVVSEDATTCKTTSVVTPLLIVQDDGDVGIGTTAPDRKLTIERPNAAYLNLRTTGGSREILMGVDGSGAIVSAMTDHDLLLRAGGNTDFVAIKADGDVGIGTKSPDAKLDIRNVPATPGGGALGADKWIRAGDGADVGRFWVEYGAAGAPLLVLSDLDDPPRIQFQQTDAGSETAPSYSSWIGHAGGKSNDIAIIAGRVGIGTTSPASKLHVQGHVRVGGSVGDLYASVAHDPLRVLAGHVDDDGSILSGSGFSVSHTSTGDYEVEYDVAFPSRPVVVACLHTNDEDLVLRVEDSSETGFRVRIRDWDNVIFDDEDAPFAFTVHGFRP